MRFGKEDPAKHRLPMGVHTITNSASRIARVLRHLPLLLVTAVLLVSRQVDLPLPFEIPTDQVMPTQEVGALPGYLSAGLDGTASYQIPLAVPPGRAGMQPNLALVYNSGGGNGPLGMGFSIAGLGSTIERCVHIHEDGGARRVRFDEQDRFCLDGQPLVLLGPDNSAYGDAGSEYRTERESIRRIVANGESTFGGPESFTVFEQDGRILTYETGVSPSRFAYEGIYRFIRPTDEGRVTVRWSLTRIEDRDGNTMEYGYETIYDPTELEPYYVDRLKGITYTAWYAEPGRRRVEVKYEVRPDPRDIYFAGVKRRLDYRIARIEMYAPAVEGPTVLAWYYAFTCVGDNDQSITGRSLLETVTRCDAGDRCLPATTFEWTKGSFRYQEVNLPYRAGMVSTQSDDANGDGRKVLLHLALGNRESYVDWLDFLRDMVGRGLRAPVLTITDGAPGLIRAVKEVFPKSLRQRCLAHKMRNVIGKVPDRARSEVKAAVQAAYYAPNRDVAEMVGADVLEKYQQPYPSAMK
jgi:hypothetical protein